MRIELLIIRLRTSRLEGSYSGPMQVSYSHGGMLQVTQGLVDGCNGVETHFDWTALAHEDGSQ